MRTIKISWNFLVMQGLNCPGLFGTDFLKLCRHMVNISTNDIIFDNLNEVKPEQAPFPGISITIVVAAF